MTSGMWFAVVKPDQPIQKKVEYGISITQAVLDTENAKVEDSITRVMMSMDNQNLVIANLSLKHCLLQTPLNLHFDKGDSIKLSVPLGSPPVYLYGVTRVDEDELLEAAASKYQHLLAAAEEEEASSDDEEAEESKKSSGTKRKRKQHPLLDKSFPSDDESDHSYIPTEEDLKNDSRFQELSLLQGDEDLDSEDDDEDEEDDGEQDAEDEEMEDDEEVEAGDSDDDDVTDDDDDVDDEEDDDDDETEEEEEEEVVIPEPSKKKMKLMNGLAEGVAQPEQRKQQQKKQKKEAPKEVKEKTLQKSGAKQPAGSVTPVQKKDDQPKSAKTQKKKFDNKENQEVKGTPKQDQKKQKGEKSPAAKPNEGSARKTPKKMLSGGIVAEDITLGNGPVVKTGNTVSVYYEGRLKSNNAVFDKNVSGPPFKFKLGRGEVIRGWDVGVAGMKVGGKRKLLVPPSMGYGKVGAAPTIPPNATLCFDVTVLAAH